MFSKKICTSMSVDQKYEMKGFRLLLKMQCHLSIFKVLLTFSAKSTRSGNLTVAFCYDGVMDMCPETLRHTHLP